MKELPPDSKKNEETVVDGPLEEGSAGFVLEEQIYRDSLEGAGLTPKATEKELKKWRKKVLRH